MRTDLSIILMMASTAMTVAQSNPSDTTSDSALESLPAPEAVSALITPRVTAAALGDVDGDGDLDAVVSRWGGTDELYRGDGTGDLVLDPGSPLSLSPSESHDVELADLDNDGLLDVVIVCGSGETNRVFVHLNGQPELTDLSLISPSDPLLTSRDDSRGVALADLNGDGWIDVVVANFGQANGVYAHEGRAGSPAFRRLAPGILHHDRGESYAVVVEDIDDDGAPDLLISNRSEDDFVYLARGETEFDFIKITVQQSLAGPSGPEWVDLGGALGDTDLAAATVSESAGAAGASSGASAPSLSGRLADEGGSGWSLSLDNAAPRADCMVVVGFEACPVPFLGGLLLPQPDLVLSGLRTDHKGQLQLAGETPARARGGQLVFQAIVVQEQLPGGHAFSNGLAALLP